MHACREHLLVNRKKNNPIPTGETGELSASLAVNSGKTTQYVVYKLGLYLHMQEMLVLWLYSLPV